MSDNWNRYLAAMHAIQSGVAMEHEAGSIDGSPKHLRVGINSAQINDAALVRLLIAKGVITLDEYEKEVADEAERMKAEYEKKLSEHYGSNIVLA